MKKIIFFVLSLFILLTGCGGGGGSATSGGAGVTGIAPASAISTVSAN